MSLGMGLLFGAAGSMMAIALALLLFEERSPVNIRPPFDWLGLLVCLSFNVGGWLFALVEVSR